LSFTYLAFVVMIVQGFLVGVLVPRLGEGRLATLGLASYACGLVLGTYQSASWLGRSLGPILSGVLFNSLGVHSPLLAGAGLLVPCVVLLLSTLSHRRRTPAPA
jgi:predicted MFS family arabinose efflux permease